MPDHDALVLEEQNDRIRVISGLEPGGRQDAIGALAVDAIDRYRLTFARFITPWLLYPAVLGSDVAGGVVGSAITRFKVGQRALSLALGVDKGRGAAEHAFHSLRRALREQHCVAPPAPLVAGNGPAEIPDAFAAPARGVSARKIAVSL